MLSSTTSSRRPRRGNCAPAACWPGHNGRSRYRTGLTGWYLKRNASLAVSEHGDFYVMSATSSLRSRLTGTTLAPSDPPLAVGVGARDGESMPLRELLRLRLEAGDEWPAP